ncbi:hypothetical protein CU031_1593 [Enterococcus faecium]|nr:hypothetical protein [Enterococcus faecium]
MLFFVPFLQILSYSVSYEKSQRKAAKEQELAGRCFAAVAFFFLDVIQSFCMFFYYNDLNLLKIYIQEPI